VLRAADLERPTTFCRTVLSALSDIPRDRLIDMSGSEEIYNRVDPRIPSMRPLEWRSLFGEFGWDRSEIQRLRWSSMFRSILYMAESISW